VPFEFDHSGSQIIFYGPQPDYAEEHVRRDKQSVGSFRELNGESPAFLRDAATVTAADPSLDCHSTKKDQGSP
jgi:hypothetical protein